MSKTAAIIVAAGKGSRMKTAESKQYLEIGGKPILVHSLERFESMNEIDEIVLVTGEQDVERCRGYIKAYGLTKVSAVVAGGSERQYSVHRGLQALSSETEWVLVHDAVRPFVRPEQIRACRREAMLKNAAVLAVPVKDTIKVVQGDGAIQSTPDRRSLWAIQTPQAFRLSLLLEAYKQAEADGFLGTDDSMLVEKYGTTVYVVEGDYTNVKITTPEDLQLAEWILGKQGEGEAK